MQQIESFEAKLSQDDVTWLYKNVNKVRPYEDICGYSSLLGTLIRRSQKGGKLIFYWFLSHKIRA
jgi:hypothetical protein